MKRVALFVGFALVVAVVVGATAGSGSDGTAKTQAGSHFGDFSTRVTSAPAWPRLRGKCNEGAVELADELTTAYRDLQSHGLTETYASLVANLNHSIPLSAAPTECDQVIAAYLTIRER